MTKTYGFGSKSIKADDDEMFNQKFKPNLDDTTVKDFTRYQRRGLRNQKTLQNN